MTLAIITWVSIALTWIILFALWQTQRRTVKYKDHSIYVLERTNDTLRKSFARLTRNATVSVSPFDRTRLTIEVDAATWAFVDRIAVLDLDPTPPTPINRKVKPGDQSNASNT